LLYLQAAVDKAHIGAAARGFKVGFINIYCDTLILEQGAHIEPLNGKYFVLEIYARKFIYTPDENGIALKATMGPDCGIVFHTQSVPADFRVAIITTNSTRVEIPLIEEGQFGISMSCEVDKLISTQCGPSESAMKNTNYLDLIDEDGHVKEKGFINEYVI
jgi:hypothetical protein